MKILEFGEVGGEDSTSTSWIEPGASQDTKAYETFNGMLHIPTRDGLRPRDIPKQQHFSRGSFHRRDHISFFLRATQLFNRCEGCIIRFSKVFDETRKGLNRLETFCANAPVGIIALNDRSLRFEVVQEFMNALIGWSVRTETEFVRKKFLKETKTFNDCFRSELVVAGGKERGDHADRGEKMNCTIFDKIEIKTSVFGDRVVGRRFIGMKEDKVHPQELTKSFFNGDVRLFPEAIGEF